MNTPVYASTCSQHFPHNKGNAQGRTHIHTAYKRGSPKSYSLSRMSPDPSPPCVLDMQVSAQIPDIPALAPLRSTLMALENRANAGADKDNVRTLVERFLGCAVTPVEFVEGLRDICGNPDSPHKWEELVQRLGTWQMFWKWIMHDVMCDGTYNCPRVEIMDAFQAGTPGSRVLRGVVSQLHSNCNNASTT